ncbi:MAG: hypothetical protein ACI4QT_03490, partial [Kiritimatiellia bacterium]
MNTNQEQDSICDTEHTNCRKGLFPDTNRMMTGLIVMKNKVLQALVLFSAMTLSALVANANSVSNSFLSVKAPGARMAEDGSIHFSNVISNIIVEVTARSGWLINGRKTVTIVRTPGSSGTLKVTSVLGEDETHIPYEDCSFSYEETTNHLVAPVVRVVPESMHLLKMYASPATHIPVSVSADWGLVSCGTNEIVRVWNPCPDCGTVHEPVEERFPVETVPDGAAWRSSAAGIVMNTPIWTGEMSKGLNQMIRFQVICTNDCRECWSSASSNVLVDVHALSIGRDDYVGLDRTDIGRTNMTRRTATVLLDPSPLGSIAYHWTDCGSVCAFDGPTNQATAIYQAENAGEASKSFHAEPLTVTASVLNEDGQTASATCTTNFTVVSVNVEIDGLDEDKEETIGAYVLYVADTNKLISVEGTNKLVNVKFTCTPNDLPTNEMVKVSCSGFAELYEQLENNELVKISEKTYPAKDIANHTFKLHGHDISEKLREGLIKIEHEGSGAEDIALYTVFLVDLDVDSDNNLKIEDENEISEDLVEDEQTKPGKALYLNELDKDKDGIPDWADGYDSNPDFGSQTADNASGPFAEMRLRIRPTIEKSVFKFSCPDVDSKADVTRKGSGTQESPYTYVGSGKKIRIWIKDGKSARKKDIFPKGDLIDVEKIYNETNFLENGTRKFFVEAIGGSSTVGDVQVTAKLYPDGIGGKSVDDAVRMTIFSIEAVHPLKDDFLPGKAGQVMISAKQDLNAESKYYTVSKTTTSGTAAQTKDAVVMATARIVPIPPEPIPNLKLRFEVTDPDDLSHYEGKEEAGTPNIQGDTNPNDNNDPEKRMQWNNGAPSGYDSFQSCLSNREIVPALVTIDGTRCYAGETPLSITHRYAGDNYRVRATLANPEQRPFDTLSGMTANVPISESSVKQSETLIAWKRVYIEQDEMYKEGCTVTVSFTPVDGVTTNTLSVDSTDDFTIGDSVVAFWPGGQTDTLTVVGKADNALTVAGPIDSVPRFGGFRIVGKDEVYTVDRRYLPNAYGSIPDGSDGGAFIEFKLLDAYRNPNARVPKYNMFPDSIEEKLYAKFWFDNSNLCRKNIAYILAAKSEVSGSLGVSFCNARTCTIYVESNLAIDNGVCLEETVVHELGHRFDMHGSSGGKFGYIDHSSVHISSHDGLD